MTVHTKMRHFSPNIMRISSKVMAVLMIQNVAAVWLCTKKENKTTFFDQIIFCHYLIGLHIHSAMPSSGFINGQHPSIKEIMIGSISPRLGSYNVYYNLYKYCDIKFP